MEHAVGPAPLELPDHGGEGIAVGVEIREDGEPHAVATAGLPIPGASTRTARFLAA